MRFGSRPRFHSPIHSCGFSWLVPHCIGGLALLGLACSYEETAPAPGLARVGEFCVALGTFACDAAETPSVQELVCEDRAFVPSRTCPGGCFVVPGGTTAPEATPDQADASPGAQPPSDSADTEPRYIDCRGARE
jgi:hypothetical protein